MEIKKEVKKYVQSEDGRELQKGMLCEFVIGDKSLCGVYQGLTQKGALKFQNTINKDVYYNVMPASIDRLRIAAESV